MANEREAGRIIVLDLKTLQILDDFTVRSSHPILWDTHYSDLCWFDGALYALLRENRCVVQIEPTTHRVLAEYSFYEMERQPEVAYVTRYPTSTFEGLAVEKDYFWFCTDNNGLPRKADAKDIRPTLFKCRQPEGITAVPVK